MKLQNPFSSQRQPRILYFLLGMRHEVLCCAYPTCSRYASNSFVVRGDQVGVFSPSKRGTSMKFQTMTDSVKSVSDKKSFSPAHAMLHQRDEKLLFLHPTEKKKIFCMDLERGFFFSREAAGLTLIQEKSWRSGRQMGSVHRRSYQRPKMRNKMGAKHS